ncbi:MAG: tetratricopeptide repeat protein [Pseudomonadota bacterium]|nr:tetratricopeptide repeat protein [Pseudomonadota bacterium]
MTYRLLLLSGLLFLLLFSYLLYLNPQSLTLHLATGLDTHGSLPFFILLSFAAGGLVMIFLFSAKSIFRYSREFKQRKGHRQIQQAVQVTRQGLENWLAADYKKAAKQLKRALKLDGENQEIRRDLIRVKLDAGEPQAAMEIIEDGLKIDPDDSCLQWLKAEVLESLGDDLRLLNHLNYLKGHYPKNVSILNLLVGKLMAQTYWQEAIAVWQELGKIAKAAKNKEQQAEIAAQLDNCRYELAVQQWHAGNREAAEQSLKEVLDRNQKYVPAYILQAAMAEQELQNPKRIETALAALKQGYSRQPNAWFLLEGERLLLSASENGEEMVAKYYRKAVSRYQDYWPARLLFAFFCLRHQRLERAAGLLAELKKQEVNNPLIKMLAGELAYRQSHQLNEAADQFKEALGLEEKPPLVFICNHCRRYAAGWLSHCPACGHYNTYELSADLVTFKGEAG